MYLDSTLTKFVTVLPRLTVWKMIALSLTYDKDASFRAHCFQLESEYKKAHNAEFKKIETKLMATISQFVMERHRGLNLSFYLLQKLAVSFVAVRSWINWARLKRKASLKVVVEAPETSTLGEYCRG
jgi:hypothetical protein